VSPRAPWHRAHHPPGKGSGVTTCPRHRVRHPPGKVSGVATCSKHRTRHPTGEGSRVTTCLTTPGRPMRRKALTLPRDRGTRTTAPQGSGITTCHVAPDTPSGAEGLQSRHVPSGPQPRACPCIPKMPDIRLIVASPDMRCRQRIKCICDMSYAVYGWH
jgi:hypothetical protein